MCHYPRDAKPDRSDSNLKSRMYSILMRGVVHTFPIFASLKRRAISGVGEWG